jgi:Icc-related predicted phosphoesterase
VKINLVSDLHLDISKYQELPGGDVLIIAGDACEARSLVKEFHSTKLLERTPGAFPCSDFFEFECAKYKKVFYVMGNHEHYGGKFWKTLPELRQVMPDNVSILENQCEEYQGVLFVGATLWTDLNKADPMVIHSIANYMNDYRAITYHYPQYGTYHKMRPMDTVKMHIESKRYIVDKAKEHTDKPLVVITHMAPSSLSVHERYKGEWSNAAYYSDLSDVILDNSNIKVWVHGHMHDPSNYTIGDCRILANPRGYQPWEGDNGFDPAFTFEI